MDDERAKAPVFTVSGDGLEGGPYLDFEYDEKKTTIPIAIVRGGKLDGQVLFAHGAGGDPENPKAVKGVKRRKPRPAQFKKLFRRVPTKIRQRVAEALCDSLAADEPVEAVDPEYRDIYEKMQNADAGYIKLPPDSRFELMPAIDLDAPAAEDDSEEEEDDGVADQPGLRDVMVICGPAGAGKSTLAREYILNYRALYPRNPVFLISKLEEDEVLDELDPPPIRLPVEDMLVRPEAWSWKRPGQLRSLTRNSLTIIDDADTFEKEETDAIMRVVNQITTLGRHNCASLLMTMHEPLEWKHGKKLYGEAHAGIYFNGMGKQTLDKTLLKGWGVYADERFALQKEFGRWFMIRKLWPKLFLGLHDACLQSDLLRDDEDEI